MSDSMVTSTVTITGHGDDDVEAYLARPEGEGPRGGVVVIHHMPGYDRKYPGQEQVAELRDILAANGKVFEEHTYQDAGHAFFAVDRPAYRVAAANDGWERIAAFYSKYLG